MIASRSSSEKMRRTSVLVLSTILSFNLARTVAKCPGWCWGSNAALWMCDSSSCNIGVCDETVMAGDSMTWCDWCHDFDGRYRTGCDIKRKCNVNYRACDGVPELSDTSNACLSDSCSECDETTLLCQGGSCPNGSVETDYGTINADTTFCDYCYNAVGSIVSDCDPKSVTVSNVFDGANANQACEVYTPWNRMDEPAEGMWRGSVLDSGGYGTTDQTDKFAMLFGGSQLHIWRIFKGPNWHTLNDEHREFIQKGGILFYSLTFWENNNADWDVMSDREQSRQYVNQFITVFKEIAPAKAWICLHFEPDIYILPEKTDRFMGSAETYRRIWEETRALFDEAGVDNAVWVMDYSADFSTVPTHETADGDTAKGVLAALWPGDHLVDWLTWNIFQFTSKGRTFEEMLTVSYEQMEEMCGEEIAYKDEIFTVNWCDKPWGIGAWGASTSSWATFTPEENAVFLENAAGVFNDMTKMNQEFPRLKAAVYFDAGDVNIDSTSAIAGRADSLITEAYLQYVQAEAFTLNDCIDDQIANGCCPLSAEVLDDAEGDGVVDTIEGTLLLSLAPEGEVGGRRLSALAAVVTSSPRRTEEAMAGSPLPLSVALDAHYDVVEEILGRLLDAEHVNATLEDGDDADDDSDTTLVSFVAVYANEAAAAENLAGYVPDEFEAQLRKAIAAQDEFKALAERLRVRPGSAPVQGRGRPVDLMVRFPRGRRPQTDWEPCKRMDKSTCKETDGCIYSYSGLSKSKCKKKDWCDHTKKHCSSTADSCVGLSKRRCRDAHSCGWSYSGLSKSGCKQELWCDHKHKYCSSL